MSERIETVNYADRWLADGLAVTRPPLTVQSLDADMTNCARIIERCRAGGCRATYTHLFIHALASTLSKNPELHRMVAGRRRHFPDRVDVGLSVSGEVFLAPVLVIEGAERKTLPDLEQELAHRVPAVRERAVRQYSFINKWGWIVPFAFLRRGLIRLAQGSYRGRRRETGTFQLTCSPNVDTFIPTCFGSTAILATGRVRDKAVPIGKEVAVRPVVTLTCSADHRVWDGRMGERFLTQLRATLETSDFGMGTDR